VTLAGVSATLRHYLAGEATSRVPVWAMIATSLDGLATRAVTIAATTGWSVAEMRSTVGGGSLPGEELPSSASHGTRPSNRRPPPSSGVAEGVRRLQQGRLTVDLRTVR
jgi:L-seryl-tRNA(Ser) seleniumtransferase